MNKLPTSPRRHGRSRRRAAVTVEFAVIAPVFLIVVLGGAEIMRLIDSKMVMETALRDGSRLATMDPDEVLEPGETMNEKIEQDIRQFLIASGIDGTAATLEIVHASDNETPFDLEDPDNAFLDFRINLTVSYSSVSHMVTPIGFNIESHQVFRNAQASLVD